MIGSIPPLSDRWFRRLVVLAVGLIVDGAILSQLIMQLSGGPRREPMDFSDQLHPQFADFARFPDGLPPFISSGGVFMPEMVFFMIGLGLGGILFCYLGWEVFGRTQAVLRRESSSLFTALCNLGQLAVAVLVGICLTQLTLHPMDVSLQKHLLYANVIFYGIVAWGFLLTLGRWRLDAELSCAGVSLNTVRGFLLLVGCVSLALMFSTMASLRFHLSALFEWILVFSALAMALSLLPTASSAAAKDSEAIVAEDE